MPVPPWDARSRHGRAGAKAYAESIANDLNEIRDRDEFGGEAGRQEAIAKAQALNVKIAGLDELYKQRVALIQQRVDKAFELRKLQMQKALAENGGPTNYVRSLIPERPLRTRIRFAHIGPSEPSLAGHRQCIGRLCDNPVL